MYSMVNFILIAVVILAIWIFFQLRSAHHHFGMYIWIAVLLFLLLTALYAFKGKPTDFQSINGLQSAFKIYVGWLGNAFQNIKSLTGSAIHMDWKGNSTR